MKQTFWDVLVDANHYRMFTTELKPEQNLALMDALKKAEPLGETWQIIKLILWEEAGRRKKTERQKPIADFMHGKVAPVISLRAYEILVPLIGTQVEFLPFETPVGPYYGLHVKYVDCLDVNHAEVVRFKSSGRIMEVEKYAFHWERLEGIHIFRLPELGLSRLFVSDEFKRVVEENGLTGLLFYPVPLADETK